MSNVMYLVRKPVGRPYQVYEVGQYELGSARIMGRTEIAPHFVKRKPRVWVGTRLPVTCAVHESPELACSLIEQYKAQW